MGTATSLIVVRKEDVKKVLFDYDRAKERHSCPNPPKIRSMLYTKCGRSVEIPFHIEDEILPNSILISPSEVDERLLVEITTGKPGEVTWRDGSQGRKLAQPTYEG